MRPPPEESPAPPPRRGPSRARAPRAAARRPLRGTPASAQAPSRTTPAPAARRPSAAARAGAARTATTHGARASGPCAAASRSPPRQRTPRDEGDGVGPRPLRLPLATEELSSRARNLIASDASARFISELTPPRKTEKGQIPGVAPDRLRLARRDPPRGSARSPGPEPQHHAEPDHRDERDHRGNQTPQFQVGDVSTRACSADSARIRLMSATEACRPEETRISWNVVGPRGRPDAEDPGPQGAVGPQEAWAPGTSRSDGTRGTAGRPECRVPRAAPARPGRRARRHRRNQTAGPRRAPGAQGPAGPPGTARSGGPSVGECCHRRTSGSRSTAARSRRPRICRVSFDVPAVSSSGGSGLASQPGQPS